MEKLQSGRYTSSSLTIARILPNGHHLQCKGATHSITIQILQRNVPRLPSPFLKFKPGYACVLTKSYKLILRVYKTGMKVRRDFFFFFQETQQNCNLCCFDIRVPLPTCPRDNRHEQALIVQIKLKHRTGLGPVVSPHVMAGFCRSFHPTRTFYNSHVL